MKSAIALRYTAALLAGLAIGGCGGGGDSGDRFYPIGSGGNGTGTGTGNAGSGDTIPASAFASVDAFIAYMKQLIASSSETSDPIALGNATAPASETADPAGL